MNGVGAGKRLVAPREGHAYDVVAGYGEPERHIHGRRSGRITTHHPRNQIDVRGVVRVCDRGVPIVHVISVAAVFSGHGFDKQVVAFLPGLVGGIHNPFVSGITVTADGYLQRVRTARRLAHEDIKSPGEVLVVDGDVQVGA